MKRKIITAVIAAIMLTACSETGEQGEQSISVNSAPETAETSAAPSETTAAVTVQKTVSPLSASARHSYYQNEDFSVTGELRKMQSSLYYPDVVAHMGGNPDMFVIELSVRVKNISSEDKTFDCSGLTLLSEGNALYMFDTENEKTENIKPGKTANLNFRALCTLSQAGAVSGMAYCGEAFDVGESFFPDAIADVIEVQSEDDVRTYLYKKHVVYRGSDHYWFQCSEPASITAHMLGRVGEDNEYFAVEYSVTNRSDYALIIDPGSYELVLIGDSKAESGEAEQVYVSTDEKLMYEPKKAGRIDGVGKVYEIPEHICMKPEGSTEFTMIYKPKGHIIKWFLMCDLHEEPYYAQYESILAKECDY